MSPDVPRDRTLVRALRARRAGLGATVELVPHLFGANQRPTGQRGLCLYWRTGADVIVDNALRVLNVT